MVKVVTRTAAIRPGPHTNNTVGNCDAGTAVPGGGPPPSPKADETAPTSPPPGGAVGNSSISRAARRGYTPLNSASPAVTALPSAIVSPASMARLKENDSSGGPVIASGLLGLCPGALAPPVFAGVQVWVIVSGLYWKRMRLGTGIGKLSVNSINAPRRYWPAIAPYPTRLSKEPTMAFASRGTSLLIAWSFNST